MPTVPKRADERRRRNKTERGLPVPTIEEAPAAPTVAVPAGDEMWHPLALDWYHSLAESGQSRFYEPSDWATARVWAEILSRQLQTQRMSAQMITAWGSAAIELLTTEGSRRRLRLELVRDPFRDPDEEAADAAVLSFVRTMEGQDGA